MSFYVQDFIKLALNQNIPSSRKVLLTEIIDYIKSKIDNNQEINLNDTVYKIKNVEKLTFNIINKSYQCTTGHFLRYLLFSILFFIHSLFINSLPLVVGAYAFL